MQDTIGPTQIQISATDLSRTQQHKVLKLNTFSWSTARSNDISYCVATPLSLCKYNRTSDKYKCTTAQIHISVSGSIPDLCCIVLRCRSYRANTKSHKCHIQAIVVSWSIHLQSFCNWLILEMKDFERKIMANIYWRNGRKGILCIFFLDEYICVDALNVDNQGRATEEEVRWQRSLCKSNILNLPVASKEPDFYIRVLNQPWWGWCQWFESQWLAKSPKYEERAMNPMLTMNQQQRSQWDSVWRNKMIPALAESSHCLCPPIPPTPTCTFPPWLSLTPSSYTM